MATTITIETTDVAFYLRIEKAAKPERTFFDMLGKKWFASMSSVKGGPLGYVCEIELTEVVHNQGIIR
jgi:hypothetical protein